MQSRNLVAADGDTRSDPEDFATVEIEVPPSLLDEIDEYAATHGYVSPDAVVREALDRQE